MSDWFPGYSHTSDWFPGYSHNSDWFGQAAGESGMMSQWNTNAMDDAQLMFGLLLEQTQCADVTCMVGKSALDISRWVNVCVSVWLT